MSATALETEQRLNLEAGNQSNNNTVSEDSNLIQSLVDVENSLVPILVELKEICHARIRYNKSLLNYFELENKKEIIDRYTKINFGEEIYKSLLQKTITLLIPGKPSVKTIEEYAKYYVNKDIICYEKLIVLLDEVEIDQASLILKQLINERFSFSKKEYVNLNFLETKKERDIYIEMLNRLAPYKSQYMLRIKKQQYIRFVKFEEVNTNYKSKGNTVPSIEKQKIINEEINNFITKEVMPFLKEVTTVKMGIGIALDTNPEVVKFKATFNVEYTKIIKVAKEFDKEVQVILDKVNGGEIPFEFYILHLYQTLKNFLIESEKVTKPLKEAFAHFQYCFKNSVGNRTTLIRCNNTLTEHYDYLNEKVTSFNQVKTKKNKGKESDAGEARDSLKKNFEEALQEVQELYEKIKPSSGKTGSGPSVLRAEVLAQYSIEVDAFTNKVNLLKESLINIGQNKSETEIKVNHPISHVISEPSVKAQKPRDYLGDKFEELKQASIISKTSKIEQIIQSSKEYLNKERIKKHSLELSHETLAMREERVRRLPLTSNITERFRDFYDGKLSHESLMILIDALKDIGEDIKVKQIGSSHFSIVIHGSYDYLEDPEDKESFSESAHSWNMQAQKLKQRANDNLPKHILERLQESFKRAGFTENALGLTVENDQRPINERLSPNI